MKAEKEVLAMKTILIDNNSNKQPPLPIVMLQKYKAYSPIVVRIALALVFLWFGISQLVNPESFIGYIPQWLVPHAPVMQHSHPLQFMHNIPHPGIHFTIMANGIFETIFGTLLLLGLFTRISALLLSLHLAIITFGLGYNDIAVRDFGLALATFSIALHGKDKFCLDNKLNTCFNN
jgi:uncharacterized membrane protein YphA (DoxX/SURF4 family)